ncbi:MAG: glycosyltransferase [Acidobacteria bacterium]|nr:glycosyltransferase [Acidobacteriota bacterium]MCB9397505.1 glycosyltransferase [Acidobacteriota bacterium]
MSVIYLLDSYYSHRKTGLDNCRLLKKHVRLSYGSEPEPSPSLLNRSKILIYHRELSRQPNLAAWRAAGLKLIAYSVWECSYLPDAYIEALRGFDEVWVPSPFCVDVYAQHGFKAQWVPHCVARPVSDPKPAPSQAQIMLFLKMVDPRKNCNWLLTQLIEAQSQQPQLFSEFTFALVGRPEDFQHPLVQLFQKTCPASRSHVDPTETELDQVYQQSDLLISAHHGEGWGLTLSEAMAQGLLVLASGWSGNLAFMNAQNAVLLPGQLIPIGSDAAFYPTWEADMLWFQPDASAFQSALKQAMQGILNGDPHIAELRLKAREIVHPFGEVSLEHNLQGQVSRWQERGWL